MPEPAFTDVERAAAKPLVNMALKEDLGREGDITSRAFFEAEAQGAVDLVAREAGVLSGLPLMQQIFATLDPQVQVACHVADGTAFERGQRLATLTGRVLSLLAGERPSLNFVSHLSGIASLTRRIVAAVAGTRAQILDTRKTLPGWRVLAKYAVRCGGGQNHRMGLYDAVLIKDNHLAAWRAGDPSRSVASAVRHVRAHIRPGVVIEVEVDTLEQLRDALPAQPEIVLLDNMSPDRIRQAVQLRDALAPSVLLEASGGITAQNVADYAATGVERISLGCLTHSVRATDLAFDWHSAV